MEKHCWEKNLICALHHILWLLNLKALYLLLNLQRIQLFKKFNIPDVIWWKNPGLNQVFQESKPRHLQISRVLDHDWVLLWGNFTSHYILKMRAGGSQSGLMALRLELIFFFFFDWSRVDLQHCVRFQLCSQVIWTKIYIYIHIYMLVCMLTCFSRIRLFATLWTVACQAPLSMEFSRHGYWSGLPFPPPGDLPNPGVKPATPESPAGRRVLYH